MRDRLIITQYGVILVAVVLGAIVGPAHAVLVALVALVAVVAIGMGRHGLWRLP